MLDKKVHTKINPVLLFCDEGDFVPTVVESVEKPQQLGVVQAVHNVNLPLHISPVFAPEEK